MKTILLFRLGAYGDMIHMSFLPRMLKEKGYDKVDVETGIKGYRIFHNNPYVNNLGVYSSETATRGLDRANASKHFCVNNHLEAMGQQYNDVMFLGGTIESAILKMEQQHEYYKHDHFRDKYRHINYYDQMAIVAGYPEEVGKWQGEVYFSDEEHSIVEEYINQYKDKFTVLMNVAGTSAHKQFQQAEELAKRILDKYEDALIITTGGPQYADRNLKHLGDRVRTIIGHQPFRQAMLLAKYVNCTIGCESGLMVASNMWGTPTIQLMTAASLENHPKYAKNDYSLQSPAYCSPCCKGPYQYIGCPSKDGYPLCVFFDINKIMEQVGKIHA